MENEEKKVSTDSLTFEEEVNESELHSKVDVDDHIYIKDEVSSFRNTLLIIIAGLLILLSLFSAIFGFNLMNDKSKTGYDVKKYNLLVTHSSGNYGGVIKSIDVYDSKKNSYEYEFTVDNNNPVDINYAVTLINPLYESDKVDMKLINYSLLKNDAEVSSGTLESVLNNELYKVTIKSNKKDVYKIKLWSSKIEKNTSFTFKISIDV